MCESVRYTAISESAYSCHTAKTQYRKFPEKELRGLSPTFHIHVSETDLYIPTIGLPILLQEIYVDRSWEYINRSQTRECGNWD
jgi:hypothetical protein